MKLIKVAPEQNRMVAALVLAAVVGIGLTIWRCKHTSPVRAMSPPAQVCADGASAAPVVSELPTVPSSNPFKRPAWALTRYDDVAAFDANGVRAMLPGSPGLSELSLPPVMVRPIGFGLISGATTATVATPKPNDEVTAPDFTLLATVRTSGRFCAAIRIGDSRVRVVQVGDIIGDGFKVREITADHAVLANETKTCIVKRRNAGGIQSQQERTDDKT